MRRVCPNCGTITTPDAPAFDPSTARADTFGSLHFGGITVHDWASDPQLDWADTVNGWRFYGLHNWSPNGYPDAATAARACWFDALDGLAGRQAPAQTDPSLEGAEDRNPAYINDDAYCHPDLGDSCYVAHLAALQEANPSQAWYWTEEWQQREREADEALACGDFTTYPDAESFLASLEDD